MEKNNTGAEYTSYEFRSTLRALGIKSFSNPGVPYDNAVMESNTFSLKLFVTMR
ncbi:MAG: transposase family protein [Erysipelotrichaceae bacterium]|nr:transposase family protein [Erysipelotrichaceae bacterium]